MGGGMDADLTHGAVAAMSRLTEGLWRPVVLQVARAPRPLAERYGLLLSDGVHSLEAVLPVSMNGLVTAGLLRAGSVVRLLDYYTPYVCSSAENNNRRVIIVHQLEVLQTECTVIGSLEIYEVNAAQPKIGSYSDILKACDVSRVKQGVTDIGGFIDPSCAAGVDDAMDKWRTYLLVAVRNKTIAEMQQKLSLKSHQGQRLAVPGNTYRTISEIKDANSQMFGQPELITVVAAISHVDMDTFWYPACKLMFNGKKCNKKVTADGDGWWCTRCLWRSNTCEYRYMLACQIHDPTGSTYATAFGKAAEDLVGHTVQELLKIQNAEQGDANFEEIMRGILSRQLILKLRIEVEPGHGVKRNIVKAKKLNYPDNGALRLIDNMLKAEKQRQACRRNV